MYKELPSLSNYCDEHFRFSVKLDRGDLRYHVNIKELESFARFMGFSHVKILSMDFLAKAEQATGDAVSKVRRQNSEELPLKFQWHSIEIYINEALLRLRAANSPDPQMAINDELNEILSREIRRHGSVIFSRVSKDELIFHDMVPIAAIAVLALNTLPSEMIDMTKYDLEVILGALILIKAFFMNSLSIICERGVHTFRPSLLEGVEIERLLAASLSRRPRDITQLRIKID